LTQKWRHPTDIELPNFKLNTATNSMINSNSVSPIANKLHSSDVGSNV